MGVMSADCGLNIFMKRIDLSGEYQKHLTGKIDLQLVTVPSRYTCVR